MIPLLLILTVWGALAGGISLYIDYLWFDAVGYLEVFQTTLASKFLFWLAGFAVSFLILGSNLYLAARRHHGIYWMSPELQATARKGTQFVFWVAILVLSVLMGMVVQSQWLAFLQYWNQVPAGSQDPIFSQDISFYIFSLPVLSFLVHLGLVLIVLSVLAAAITYVTHGHLAYLQRLQLSHEARVHLTLLAVAGFLLLAGRFWLNCYEILYSREGVIFGAGYTDVYARLPCTMILAGVSVLTAAAFAVSIFGRNLRTAVYSGVFFGAAYLALNLYPMVIQTFIVEPNELQVETPYLAHNIGLTRKAYNLDKIEVHDFSGSGDLSREDMAANETTIGNIRLWGWRPLMDSYNQLQSIRSYYEFQGVDLDRYVIDGKYRQVMLSARELDFSKISEQAQTWINEYFVYTHGYGLCLSPVNEVTPEGLPEFFIKDIPPQSNGNFEITRPEIYFGEKTDNPVFVKTAQEEFDYPIGDRNAFTTYQAERGLGIGSFVRKLLFAWELKNYKILFADDFMSESRVLLHRRIQDRVPKIAPPGLDFDPDPYLVIHEGRLFWIQDGYTSTGRYPYSEPTRGGFNYIRNSLKVVVDAYLGDVTFYVSDPDDPLIQVYSAIFPSTFRPLGEMPEGLRLHLRYPEVLFNVQREMFRTYHMRDTGVFYNKEDMWDIPTEIYRDQEQVMESYYVIMNLPGSQEEEFILLVPYTPRNKNNMISWLAARSDGEHYGTLVLYQFPKQELRYGPLQIEARIDQDPTISPLLTLWSQQGSEVIRGNLLVIPIEDTLLYVEPLYLQAEKSMIPELTRIIVVFENRVALGETLDEALAAAIWPDEAPGEFRAAAVQQLSVDSEIEPGRGGPLMVRALQIFNQSQKYLREGNWAAYGEEQERLKQVLEQLVRQSRD